VAFDAALSIASVLRSDTHVHHFDWDVPDGWQQERGAWGGLIVGAVVRSVMQCDPARDVRAVNVQIPTPVLTGTQRITVTPVKLGSAVSMWSVRIGDAVVGGVLTGVARVPELESHRWGQALMPQAPPWQEVPVLAVAPPDGPVFSQHVEYRLLQGFPFQQGAAQMLGYIRLRDESVRDAAYLLGLVDAPWPASLAALDVPHPAVTVSFEAHLLVDPADIPDEPLLYSASVLAARDGYTTERRSLWASDGRLVVENLQTIVIIR
jgi:hypothetical protein